MLMRFDTELRELYKGIKAKEQAASDAEVGIKKLDQELQALVEGMAGHVTAATKFEKQYEWISEESQWVKEPATVDVFIDLANARVTTVCSGKRDRSMTFASLICAS
jgi:hypothetical protein